MILIANNIHKTYGQHSVLDDVCLKIPSNTIFGLLGPNGAGKTTLIRILTQITAPDSGDLYFDGVKFNKNHIYQIGYLPEERGLYKKMKVGEQCLYLAQLKGLNKKKAKYLLLEKFRQFDIIKWWDKKIEELSKGMAQKVQFISTIIHQPKLLIFDEPFSGFDPINAEAIKKEIINLKNNGTSIILSTHRMESVEELCDHIALLDNGKCILNGEINQIKQQYKSHTYSIKFEGTINNLKDLELVEVKKNSAIIKAKAHYTSNEIISILAKEVSLIEFKEDFPSINDIFIKNIGA